MFEKEDHFGIANTIIMGALKEIVTNRNFAYISHNIPISQCELTTLGEKYVIELVQSVLPLLIKAQNVTAKETAEMLMLDKLSK